MPDSLDKISGVNVKNGTDIRATNQKFGWLGTTSLAAGTKRKKKKKKAEAEDTKTCLL